MIVYEDKNELIIELGERIDYSNAAELETEIGKAMKSHPGLPLCLDADRLTYISSAGLRVLMKLRKEQANGLTVRNVSGEVYEIFETTGMNQIISIQKKLRAISVDGCEVIGQGASATVYRLDEDTVVKIYNGGEEMLPAIEEDQKRARQAFISGIPTAIPLGAVRAGDRFGAAFEMIDVHNLNDVVKKDHAALSWIIPRYAAFIKSLHMKEAYDGQLPSARDHYFELLDVFAPRLTESVLARLRELLGKMPDDRHVLHGDPQLKNIMLSGDEMMMIDLDHLCAGNPVFEFGALFATYVAFDEVDPMDTTRFLGIDKDIAARIFQETLREYLRGSGEKGAEEIHVPAPAAGNDTGEILAAGTDADDDYLAQAELKIQVAGYLRFLTILVVEKKDEQGERKERMVRHAADRLAELVFQAEELTI